MRKIKITLCILSVLSLVFITESFAQRGMRQRGNTGWGSRSVYNRMYNPATLESIKGEVVKVDKIIPLKGMSYGIHIMLKTKKETVSVHLGPAWYFNSHNYIVNIKDKIEITGSRITYNGKPAVIASEMKTGNKVIKLRDENGYPLWSGSKRK